MTDLADVEREPRAEHDADEPEIFLGSREQLLHLLAEAAEIEHTLMCSYLYAAFSLKRPSEPGLSKDEGAAVERWRKAVVDVAVEEMGHLLIVANLTVAVGGRAHFARPNFPVSPGYFPSGVVVRLRGFSMETLEHFIFLERPQGTGDADGETFEQRDYVRAKTFRGLMPTAQNYNTIGHLYEAIRANLIALTSHLGEARVFVGSPGSQIGHEVSQMMGVEAISGLEAACKGLDVIVEQGEGSPADREDSHYRSFLGVREDYQRLLEVNPTFAPAWPVVDDPALRRPADGQEGVYIDDPHAAELLDFANATYGLLLRLIVQGYGRQVADPRTQQARLLSTAIGLMHVLAEAAERLARMSGSDGAPGMNAGMSFTMLRGVEPLLHGRAEEELLGERLQALAAGGRRLRLDTAATLTKMAASFRIKASP